MKKIQAILILGIAIPMLMFLFSCAGMKEHRAEETQAVTTAKTQEAPAAVSGQAEETPAGTLLADKHKAAGVACSDCHAENPPAVAVTTDTCLKCHEDYKDQSNSYIDPHNAHITYSDCSDCHHAHKAGEMICQGCHHSFNIQAP